MARISHLPNGLQDQITLSDATTFPSTSEDNQYEMDPKIINRRGIYKDLYKSGKPYEDYQLRANFPIAMTVAPELFTPDKALIALSIADSVIVGPLGRGNPRPIRFQLSSILQ